MSRYLAVHEVIEINAEVVRKVGGIHGLRDSRALPSAVGRLESGYYAETIEEAAARGCGSMPSEFDWLMSLQLQPPASRKQTVNCLRE